MPRDKRSSLFRRIVNANEKKSFITFVSDDAPSSLDFENE
jgi:hypothetical protein